MIMKPTHSLRLQSLKSLLHERAVKLRALEQGRGRLSASSRWQIITGLRYSFVYLYDMHAPVLHVNSF